MISYCRIEIPEIVVVSLVNFFRKSMRILLKIVLSYVHCWDLPLVSSLKLFGFKK